MTTRPDPQFQQAIPRNVPEIGEHMGEMREVQPGVLFFPVFGNVTAFLTDEGVVLFDTGTVQAGAHVLQQLRTRTDAPVHTIAYSHGHLDHVGGAVHFIEEARRLGRPRPRVIGQRRLVARLRRYERMWPWIGFIGTWQWDPRRQAGSAAFRDASQPPSFVYPDVTVDERLTFEAGGERFDLFHALGETDDVLWLWNERRGLVCSGDLLIYSSPNVGNPWKVQRYTEEWAEALEAIATARPDVILPGHGPVTTPAERAQEVTLTTARYLRSIHDQVVERMNQGRWLEQIWHEVEPPADLASARWLQPSYGHPKFIVQGVWRQYGGWWDGNPASFFPARTDAQAREIVAAAGADPLLARARELQQAGDLALACHLVDWVRRAEPDNADAWRLWRDLFAVRAENEPNMMARNTFRHAARDGAAELARLGAEERGDVAQSGHER
jgi:glyoxylase-like metal-dependent hydrolase (beta-lactamase superfamily II)